MSGVTRILERVEKGDPRAAEELLPLVYGELRRLAAHLMTGERPGHTLQPTALVHEAWLRLGGDAQPQWQNRAHFFGAAAEAMRRILVEHARRRLRAKRGGGVEPLDVNEIEIASPIADDDGLVRLSDALEKFAVVDSRKAELVKLRYFVGMTHEEAAEKVVPIHKAKLLSYMKLLDVPLGLLINFHEMKVTDGISRLILPGANL